MTSVGRDPFSANKSGADAFGNDCFIFFFVRRETEPGAIKDSFRLFTGCFINMRNEKGLLQAGV